MACRNGTGELLVRNLRVELLDQVLGFTEPNEDQSAADELVSRLSFVRVELLQPLGKAFDKTHPRLEVPVSVVLDR